MSKKTQAIIAVIIGNGIFGFSFLFSKIALQLTIPSVLIATRFLVAFLVLNILVLLGKLVNKKRGTTFLSFSLTGKPMKKVLLLALFQPVIYFIAENYGILYTSSAFAGIIIAVIPIAGIVFDIVFMHAKVSRRQIICALGSVIGVVITSLGARDMTSSVKGIIFLLIAVVAGALFYVFSKSAAKDFNPLERTYVMFGVGSGVYLVLALVQCWGNYEALILTPFIQAAFWRSVLYLSIISSVVAFLLLNFGSNYISVSQASMFANLTTVISILAGVLILRESFTLQQLVGAILILVCVYISSKS